MGEFPTLDNLALANVEIEQALLGAALVMHGAAHAACSLHPLAGTSAPSPTPMADEVEWIPSNEVAVSVVVHGQSYFRKSHAPVAHRVVPKGAA